MSTVCLCMMVKDEAHVIERALASALPWVDAVSIYDTGSTDNTLPLASAMVADKRLHMVGSRWVNFAHGRTQAFREAQTLGCDYILVMDADQTLVVTDPNYRDTLRADGYDINIVHANLTYPHPWLLRSRLNWRWEGVTHEWLTCDDQYSTGVCTGVHLVEHADSHRRTTGAKGREDLALLEAEQLRRPEDPRTVFYLAQAEADAGKFTCALKHYKERIAMGGWLEERWCAQYRIGQIHEGMHVWEYAADAYMRAWNMLPARAEPLYRLARGYLMQQQFSPAYLFFNQALPLKPAPGGLFVETAVYAYLCRWGLSMALRLLGHDDEAQYVEDSILGNPSTPEHVVTALLESRRTKSIGLLP